MKSRILKEAQAGINAECCDQQTTGRPATSAERILMDLSNQASRAQDEEARSLAALEFFGKHPEFAEFIGLIRSGSISI
jgi:hypothetical protein